jgi:glycosyltransferase involved in cell wall biosynthesis
MIPVSIIIATRNEESMIEDCLRALSKFDDVILVDSHSTDRTQEIARSYGAKIFNFSWDGRYPKKRQWCLDNVPTQYPWIFFVDADEILTPELVDEIAALDFSAAGYFVSGRYIWDGVLLRHGVRNNKLALLRKGAFMFPVVDDLDLPMGEMEGHYQPVLKAEFKDEKIGFLCSALDHYADHAPGEWQARHERYARWEAGMNHRHAWPEDPVAYRQALKEIFRRMKMRGVVMFLYCYVWKRGFLDGRAGFDFARARARYYRMIECYKI